MKFSDKKPQSIEEDSSLIKNDLNKINDGIPGGVAQMRYDGNLIVEYANDGLFHLMNLTREDFKEKFANRYDLCVYHKDWSCLKEKIVYAIQHAKSIQAEYRIMIQGHMSWRMMHASILEQDNVIYLQCVITDITELMITQENLNSLIDNIPGGILRVSYREEAPKLLYASQRIYELTGYSNEEFLKAMAESSNKQQWFGKYAPEEWKRLRQEVKQGILPPEQYRIKRKDKSVLWVEMRGSVVLHNQMETVIQFVAIDITEKQKNYLRAEQEREILNIVADMSADLIFEYHIEKDFLVFRNKNNEHLIREEAFSIENYSKKVFYLDRFLKDDNEILKELVAALKQGRPIIGLRIRKKYEDASYQWCQIDGRPIFDDVGRPERVVGKVSNIHKQVLKEINLKKKIECDSLTGLFNYSTIKAKTATALGKLRNENIGYLFIIDIDNFKHINDSMGHLYGDAVLCAFAEEIKQCFAEGLCGRFGGDEFLVFMPDSDDKKMEESIVSLNQRLGLLFTNENTKIKVSCSAGLTRCIPTDTLKEALYRADSALFFVKSTNKGGVRIYEGNIDNINDGALKYVDKFTDEEKKNNLYIENENDLILFVLEILEKVTDIKGGLRLISDRICRYYSLHDIIYLTETKENQLDVHFHWQGSILGESKPANLERNDEYWDRINQGYNEEGISVLRHKDISKSQKEKIKSVITIKIKMDMKDGYILFLDREEDRSFEEEAITLKQLAHIILARLKQLEQKEHARLELENLLFYDKLTGLLNYQQFLEQTEKLIADNSKHTYALIYSDFSNFQYLNEVYGFSSGDLVLQRYAKRLKERCKYGYYFARVTSDHFISIQECPDIVKVRNEFVTVCQEFCEEINQEFVQCNLMIVSGISEIKKGRLPLSNCIDNANTARKIIKNIAETNCAIFEDDMRKVSEFQMRITANMKRALENHEFLVYYQPQFDLKTEVIASAEALVRWQLPDGTLIFPDQFIPIFEKNGFIRKIDFYVLEQVLKMQKKLLDLGLTVVPVAVNFSRRHQEDSDFVEKILSLIKQYQIPPQLLEIEVTESVITYDLDKLNENIKRLKNNQVCISLDDFGSGYSSLNVLLKVEADFIKLDKQFMADWVYADNRAGFIKYLVQMLKHMGFKIVAEGVETKEQVQLLKKAECDYVQGYYYERPIPEERFLHKYYDFI